ncbi:DUF1853 family protein [Formosa sediminum]|uniref:DUF1853 family protein n=1 Tax=Formosa sediminum TaxID=2594004 RepID=A0A516GTN5_9FLAO|nr:DUF1853 family protein [Formosa sediminum]QDO94862.1 DUF1853 family protein [Formosa sediminum]
MQTISKQYIGYKATPVLWKKKNSWGLTQFTLSKSDVPPFNAVVNVPLRLGKLVERFVSFDLCLQDDVDILAENIQIQENKRTLGEIDCILKQGNQYIHLEIVYKFYLYDPEVGATEYEHWIGPNRKDSLIDKLTKLKDKQLPLLYNPATIPYLDNLKIAPETIAQHVYFKAQLFVPYNTITHVFGDLNPDCIAGVYIHFNALSHFKDSKFYMPKKLNWLCNIEMQVPWLTFFDFKEKIKPLILNKTAPLCWVKQPNGLTLKCFVVWW